jgi:hypothetical protein
MGFALRFLLCAGLGLFPTAKIVARQHGALSLVLFVGLGIQEVTPPWSGGRIFDKQQQYTFFSNNGILAPIDPAGACS